MAGSIRQLILGVQKLSLAPAVSKISLHNAISSRALHCTALNLRHLDGRAHPHSVLPSTKNGKWEPRKKFAEEYEYTTKHLPFPRTGGRGPNGRIWNHKRGGGHKRNFRMIDWVRGGTGNEKPLTEEVHDIQYDPNRSARIALVAAGTHKRYVIATQNMKKGDLINSYNHFTPGTVRSQEGDAHPLGALAVGTMVNSVQLRPGEGGRVANSAGTAAQLIRKLDDGTVLLRMPSKQEVLLSAHCQATVGRVSNIDHNKRVIGKAGRNRWLGIRPKSGRWKRKTGRFGRKIRPNPPMKDHTQAKKPKADEMRFALSWRQLNKQ